MPSSSAYQRRAAATSSAKKLTVVSPRNMVGPSLGTTRPDRLARSASACDTILRPKVLTCGHVHESPGIAQLEDTLVVNCTMGNDSTSGALIELGPDGVTAHLL